MRDRFKGALLGLIVGDALGAPYEGAPRGSVNFEGEMGVQDFPEKLVMTVTLKPARPRDKAEIETMFNAGRGRFYIQPTDDIDINNTQNTSAYGNKDRLKYMKDNKEYKNLMSMKAKEMNVKIYYSGDTDSIDEVIAFGFSDQKGVGVARLIGENMNPAKIIETIKSMDFNENSPSLKQFSKMFKKN